jgi:hypothetical protein
VLMIGDVGMDYPGADIGPPPFSAEHPPLVGYSLTKMISKPPSSFCGGVGVDGHASSKDVDAPTLGFGPPPVVAPTLVARVVAVDGGSWRRQRSPAWSGKSLPRSLSPLQDR